jgi:hypothetical protein
VRSTPELSGTWRVWTGPVGGWHDWLTLERLSPRAQELYAVMLAVSEPMPAVHPLPGRTGRYWGRRVQLSLAQLADIAGVPHITALSSARRELERAGLVAVLERGRGVPRSCNVYAVACGLPGAWREA